MARRGDALYLRITRRTDPRKQHCLKANWDRSVISSSDV